MLALRAQVEEQRCYATDFQADENNINSLPREMLVRIMQKLPVSSTVGSRQRWRRCAKPGTAPRRTRASGASSARTTGRGSSMIFLRYNCKKI